MDNWSYLAAGKGDILLPPTLDRRRKQDQSPSGGRTSHAVTVYRRKGVYAGRFAHSGMPCTTAVFRRDQAPSLRAQGYSWREIAGRLGTSVASVRRACQTPNVSSLGVAKTPKHILAPCCDTAALLGEWRSKRCLLKANNATLAGLLVRYCPTATAEWTFTNRLTQTALME